MKLIIEISDGTYSRLKKRKETTLDLNIICKAVYNGTPLPKGHGRLIDVKEIESTLHSKAFDLAGTTRRYTEVRWALKQVRNAPTIIEADREGENG